MLLGRDPSVLTDEVVRGLADEGYRALTEPYGDGTEEFMPSKPHAYGLVKT